MKLKELWYFIRKPAPRIFAGRMESRDVGTFGVATVAQWTHPRAESLRLTERMITEMQQFVRAGDFAIDIGAHCGDSTLPIAFAASSSGEVIALEPNRFIFPVLAQNASLNRMHTNITPYALAALDKRREVEFEYGDPDFMNGGESVAASRFRPKFKQRVQGENIGELLTQLHGDRLSKLTFIKTDVEGHDLAVLKTLQPLIELHRPVVKSEVFTHLSDEGRRALYAYFSDLGYRVHLYGGDESMLGRQLAASDMAHARRFDLLCLPV